jgi:hypothetical protein
MKASAQPHLPEPRGRLSEAIISAIGRDPQGTPYDALTADLTSTLVDDVATDVVGDGDLQLALWTVYELSYRGFVDVDDRWEWHPALLVPRRRLEELFEAQLRAETRKTVARASSAPGEFSDRLFAMIEQDDGPALASHLLRQATREQMVEFLRERSIYHLKESDPHSFVLPRLTGQAKVTLAELQYDEYGAGRPGRLHSTLFATTLEECGLSSRYAAYIDTVTATTLAVNNAMSMFALNRRLHAADMGHLGAFEATSSLPCRRVAGGLRRLGFGDTAADYFDEHVEADAVHEQLAVRGICAELAEQSSDLAEDVLFGAASCLLLDARASDDLMHRWRINTGKAAEFPHTRQMVVPT